MLLKNKKDGEVYHIQTETDHHRGFMIFAEPLFPGPLSFCMHYHSLAEFNDDWKDV